MKEDLIVKFWGVRGSYPTPGQDTVAFGGNTACVEIRAGEHVVILDAGTGIIPLGRDLSRRATQQKRSVEAILLFSHLHHDHTQGFPFFGPAYNPASHLHLFGPGASEQALEDLLAHNQQPPAFPVTLRDMSAAKEIRSLTETDLISVEADGVRLVRNGDHAASGLVIRLLKSYAHPGGVYIYRIEWRGQSVVYASDIEGYVGGDRRLMAFARGADLLIHDAQYSEAHYRGQRPGLPATQGYGHSTPQMACEMALAAGVRQLALFHHDPNYDDATLLDLESQARGLFPATFSAREGLEVSVSDERMPVAVAQDALSRYAERM
ncbi:MAG: MBL fold metallo-hydrolase [Anaerolineae bacterium]|nr:MBL fold metallo-hydrolase [Anaerolineae bacterium]